MNVVLDTNVLVSGLLSPFSPRKIFWIIAGRAVSRPAQGREGGKTLQAFFVNFAVLSHSFVSF
ncbi:MAG: hypothetical protein NTV49_03645 [Kiritimatiellaeota bacterium]|nr:hypothetical protein [Kiritimatiellota bacterium]